jgi:hypothetical protein
MCAERVAEEVEAFLSGVSQRSFRRLFLGVSQIDGTGYVVSVRDGVYSTPQV